MNNRFLVNISFRDEFGELSTIVERVKTKEEALVWIDEALTDSTTEHALVRDEVKNKIEWFK